MHPTPSTPPTLFPLNTGRTLPVVEKTDGIQLHYEHHPHGKLYLGNSLAWLGTLASESMDLVFADPPYKLSPRSLPLTTTPL